MESLNQVTEKSKEFAVLCAGLLREYSNFEIKEVKKLPEPPKPSKAVKQPKHSLKVVKPVFVRKKHTKSRFPKPLWEIIISYCEITTCIVLEKVCSMFFSILNSESRWRTYAEYLGASQRQLSMDCAFLRKLSLQLETQQALDYHLNYLKSTLCRNNLHCCEELPNKRFYGCFYCRKGFSKNSYCSQKCQHGFMCHLSQTHSFHLCPICEFTGSAESFSALNRIFKKFKVKINPAKALVVFPTDLQQTFN